MRRARWRRAVCSAAALACVLPLLVITPGAQARPSVEPPHGQITIGMPQFPDTLSPYQGDLPIDAQVQAGMFAPFAYIDGHGWLVPDLLADIPSLKNHQVLDGGRTVILRLKLHRYWSSGAEITSADVVFGWKVDRDPLTGPACAANGCMVRSMQATGPYTVVAKLAHLPPDDDLTWLPDLVPHGWKKLGRSSHAAARILYQDSSFNYEWPGPENWVSGPYRVQNVVNNDRVVLRISPHSAGTEEPHVARLLYLFYAGDGDLIGALTSGAVDIATELLPADLPALRKAAPGNFRIIMRPTYDLEHLELNVGNTQFRGAPNPLTDVRVRQALALATDREGLMRSVLHLGPEQIRSLIAYTPWLTSQNLAEAGADTAITGAWDPLAHRYVAYGPAALRDARTLLAQAGFPQGLDLEIYSPTRPQDRRESAAFIAETWAQIGVRVGIEPNKKCPPVVGPCLAPLQFTDFEVAVAGADAGPDPRLLEPWLVPPATSPSGYYEPCCLDPAGIDDPKIERVWRRAASARTPAERNTWYRRIQERIVKQAYWIPLYWLPEITAVSPRIKGFGESGEAPVWRPQDWRLGN